MTNGTAPPMAIAHIPHASLVIPPGLRGTFCLSDDALKLELLRMTDRYTDELFDLGAAVATTVRFPVSRLVVDPERFLDDDSEPMAGRGMGVIYTRTSQGEALRVAVESAVRESLLARYYR